MRDKWGHESLHKFVDCDAKEYGAYLQYKKRKMTLPCPKDQLKRCVDWMGRPSPTTSPCQSDDENEDCSPSHNSDAVQALLGMAATHTHGLYSENNMEDGDDEYGWSELDVATMQLIVVFALTVSSCI